MEVLVVIPTYNEAENIRPLAEQLLALNLDLGLLFVDDSSPDGTGRIAEELARQKSSLSVMHREGKQGLGTAYVAGFKWALENTDATLIAQMDADFSHHPSYLPHLAQAARQGVVAVGSRYITGGGVKNWGLGRRLLSKGGNVYASAVLGLPMGDITGGYKCWPRQALETLDLSRVNSGGYAFQAEMSYLAHRAGFKMSEVPIIFEDRRVGQSKMSLGIALEAFWLLPKLRLQDH